MKYGASLARILIASLLSSACLFTVHAGGIEVMDDFDFGTWSPLMTRWKKEVPVCIWDEESRQISYRVVASGINDGTRFRLRNDIGDYLPYQVEWQDDQIVDSGERLKANVGSTSVYSSYDNHRCENGATGHLVVTISNNILQQATPGLYSDTLVLMISAI